MENQAPQQNPPVQQPTQVPAIKVRSSNNWLLIFSIVIFAIVTAALIGTLGYLLSR